MQGGEGFMRWSAHTYYLPVLRRIANLELPDLHRATGVRNTLVDRAVLVVTHELDLVRQALPENLHR